MPITCCEGTAVQALIELSPQGSDERLMLESIMNHVRTLRARATKAQTEIGI